MTVSAHKSIISTTNKRLTEAKISARKLSTKKITVDTAQEKYQSGWSEYEISLDRYEQIGETDLHICLNELGDRKGIVGRAMALAIARAMIKNKPIIILHPPIFHRQVGAYLQNIILRRIDKILICDFLLFDNVDMVNILTGATNGSVNYVLTKNESSFIKAALRSHLRELLVDLNLN